MAVARFTKICIDANDPLALGRFWADVIGYELEGDDRPADQREAGLVADEQWRVWFNRVPQPKQVKNRVHLDLNVGGGLEADPQEKRARIAAEAERLVAAGAARQAEFDEGREYWLVMQDPEGNEFCIQ